MRLFTSNQETLKDLNNEPNHIKITDHETLGEQQIMRQQSS